MDEGQFQQEVSDFLRIAGHPVATELPHPAGMVDVSWVIHPPGSKRWGRPLVCGLELKVTEPCQDHLNQMSKYTKTFDWFSLCYPAGVNLSWLRQKQCNVSDTAVEWTACAFSPTTGFTHLIGKNGGMKPCFHYSSCSDERGRGDIVYRTIWYSFKQSGLAFPKSSKRLAAANANRFKEAT